ncbi:MAG: AAA family ATPase [Bacteroidaceae bacterium]|nr:AAA family ATPase [Bacteroidaceae bacterium]
MNSIVIFNNKGGVGKTTLLCNLAAYYSLEENKKVLIIDADPQCNATSYLLKDEKLEEYYSSNYNGEEGSIKTLYDYIEPYREGDSEIELPIKHSDDFNVDLVLGDTKLSFIEDFLSGEWAPTDAETPRAMKTICFLKTLYNKIENKYDYVFIDVGPSLGVLNRLILLFSNCFIMPNSSDIFSLKAIENISEALGLWKKHFEELQDKYKEQKKFYYKKDNKIEAKPMFLGYVNQLYTSRTNAGKREPVKAYEKIISEIPQKVSEKMREYYPEDFSNEKLKIGEIPNFNSLIPMSQIAHKPIFKLKSEDGVLGAHFAKVADYLSVMKSIVANINSNLREYGMA